MHVFFFNVKLIRFHPFKLPSTPSIVIDPIDIIQHENVNVLKYDINIVNYDYILYVI